MLVGNTYTYDNAGQRLTNTLGSLDGGGNAVNRVETYGYDELNRVSSVNYGDGQTQNYTFDAMGNRLSKTDAGGGIGGTENYGYNNANMLLSRAGNAYTNDADGNTLTGGGRTNTWDSQNRMTKCVNGANTSTFTYGADGIRRRSVVNGVATDFVTDMSMFVRELSGGSSKATYFMGASGPAYRRDDVTSSVRWYLYDGLGSVLGEVDPNGSITATRKYDVYGAVRSSTGTSTSKHKFVGQLGHPSEDETGLTYMRARYYDPQTGRFVSQDPNMQGRNWFAYCGNDPINRVDESGKDWNNASPEEKLDWFALGAAAMSLAIALCLIVDPLSGADKLRRVAAFVSFEVAMGAYSMAALGLPDGPSRICNISGWIAGVAGALVGMIEGGKAAFYTEAGVAIVALISETVIVAGYIDSIGKDIPPGG